MLDVLRASKGGILSWILIGAIIAVFVLLFGPGALQKTDQGCSGAPTTTYAAKVDGKPIPAVLFRLILENQIEVARMQFGDRLNEVLPYLGEEVMNSLVTHGVLAREAERRGLQVSDEDIFKAQWDKPEFQVEGTGFDKERFSQRVTRRYGSVGTYLGIEHDSIAVDRLQAAFDAAVHVPEAEVHDAWKNQSDMVDLAYVVFPTADARAEVKPTDAEVQAFAAKELQRIQKYYDDNAAKFEQPKKVRVRHILAKIEGSNSDAAKQKIEAAIARLGKGEEFAKVAGEVSDDASTKASGGDLGVISAGQVDEAFAKAALSLEAGKLSGPVQTPAGWHVLKVDEIIPEKKVSLAEAKTVIARELFVEERAAALVKQKAEAALQAARAGKKLTDLYPTPVPAVPAAENRPATPEVKAALTLGGKPVAARETNPFPASATEVGGLPGSATLLQDAIATDASSDRPVVLPKVYDTTTGPAVAVVRQRLRPDEKLYPVQRHAIEVGLHGEKVREMQYVWRAQLAKRTQVDKNETLLRALTGGGKQENAPAEQQ